MGRKGNLLAAGVALILFGVVGLGVVFLLGSASSVMGSGGMDEMFIEQMTPHHDAAIAMAELALERSERPEIRQLAEDIRRSQTAENAQMRDWYGEWYGGAPDIGGGMGMGMREMTDLRALESALDFDKEFIEQMIPHHEMAVMMTSMVGNAGGRQELRELADSMRRAQSREIELMRGWYEDWYGR